MELQQKYKGIKIYYQYATETRKKYVVKVGSNTCIFDSLKEAKTAIRMFQDSLEWSN